MEQFLEEIKTELNHILTYWSEKTIDEQYGGFYGQINGQNQLIPQADKGIILNTRILWTFSAAYRYTNDIQHLELAQRAYQYLTKYFLDTEFGGVFWVLDYQGKPTDTKKQIYAQAFAVYALSEYYRITEDNDAKKLAIELYELIEKYSFDQEYGGYLEAFDREWRLLDDLRLSDKDANEKKTMNTHLHVLEGYTNLYRIWKDDTLKNQLTLLIYTFLDKFVDKQTYHFHLFFDEHWNLKSNAYSYGHDIEGSWLLLEAAEVLEDYELIKKLKNIAVKMVDITVQQGLDTDGGLMNEGEAGKVYDTDKHWWPQIEAMVGLVNAYQITQNQGYLHDTYLIWNFTKKYIIDAENGEWFFRVNQKGEPYHEEDKVGLWKCPYHNGRGCLEILQRFGK